MTANESVNEKKETAATELIGRCGRADKTTIGPENETKTKTMKYNIDVHFDYAMAVTVEAESEEEAREKLEQHIEDGLFPYWMLERTDDYELDTDYQPEDPESLNNRLEID